MSLKVWLPLCGDLRQQGCSNYIPSLASGNTWATSGKISSSSLTLTKIQTILPNSSCMSGAKEVSYCYWVKVNTAWSANWLDGIRWTETDGSATSTARQEFYTNCTLIGTWYKGGSISGKSFTPGVWTHLAATINYTTGEAKFYINGVLTGTTSNVDTTYSCRGDFYIGDNGVDICENDVRIYDHCLSAAEVHEISQGLVLHYKLNEPNPNMLLMTPKSYTPTTYCGYQLSLNENLIVDQTYTLQLWDVTVEHSAKTAAQMNLCVYWGGGSIQLKNFNGTSNFKTLRDHYAYSPYLVATFTITSSQASGNGATNAWFNIYNSVGWVSGTVNMHIGTWKLEKGNIATSWTPNITTIIEDSSGYNHNGTILNTISISSDTPRYSCSTNLEAANSMINCGRGGMVTDSITVNFWLKSSTWANPVSCTEGGGWNFEASGDYFRFPIYISGVGYKNGQSATTKAQLCNNQWHMLTGIYDRINQKVQIYVDGKLDNDYAAGTSNNIGYHSSNVIWIGAEATGSNTTASNGMAGLFSDFRIYCTALSAADVKQLYELGAKVDNKQNLHAFELIENSPIKITKRGQIKCQELNENENTKFYKTGIVETAEIIEL